jgi:hypothetical protein
MEHPAHSEVRTLVGGGLLRVVDDEGGDRALGGFELQT